MNEDKTGTVVVTAIVVGIIFYFIGTSSGKSEVISEPNSCDIELVQTQDKLKETAASLYEHREALIEANRRIMNANYYAWDDYNTMGDTLDELQPVDDPPQPIKD